jgi:hypothetical protein
VAVHVVGGLVEVASAGLERGHRGCHVIFGQADLTGLS